MSSSSSRHNDRVLLIGKKIVMSAPNDLKFDTETYLLFSIYYEAYGVLKGMDGSAATYLQRFEKEIRGTGQVLEWLGLARTDKKSPLGCKPSHLLMSLIVEPRRCSKSKKSFAYPEDAEVFDMIFDATVGDVEEWSNIPSFVFSVLRLLGLAKESDLLDTVPTPQLYRLAAERRQEERERQRDEQRAKA
jgi:hypothetical protein